MTTVRACKIIQGSFGVRRPRKKAYVHPKDVTELPGTLPVKERNTVREGIIPGEAAPLKESKPVRQRKETKKDAKEEKPETTVKLKKE